MVSATLHPCMYVFISPRYPFFRHKTPLGVPVKCSTTADLSRCAHRRQQFVVMPEEDLVAVSDKMDCQTAAQFYVSMHSSRQCSAYRFITCARVVLHYSCVRQLPEMCVMHTIFPMIRLMQGSRLHCSVCLLRCCACFSNRTPLRLLTWAEC